MSIVSTVVLVALAILIVLLLLSLVRSSHDQFQSPRRPRAVDPFRKVDEADEFLRRARERARRDRDNLHDGNDN